MAESYKYQPFYKDLSGPEPTSRMDVTINKILNKLSEYVQIEDAKKDRMALNVLENVVRQSSDYNSDDQFESAFKSLEAISDQLTDPVSTALIDTHFNHLKREHKNYTADTAISEMMIENKNRLTNMTELNITGGTGAIMASLDTIAQEFKGDASANIQASLDKHIEDVGLGLYIVQLLDLYDAGVDDENWDFEKDQLKAQHAADAFRRGDFKRAQRLLEDLQFDEHDEKWDYAADSYDRNKREYNILVGTGMRDKKHGGYLTGETRETGLFPTITKEVVVGSDKLDAISINTERKKWNDKIVSNLLRSDIELHTEIDKKLRSGRSVSEIYDFILSDKGAGANAHYHQVIEWIAGNNKFVQDPGWTIEGKVRRAPGSNHYLAQVFYKQLIIHQDLFEQSKKLGAYSETGGLILD